MKTSKNSFLSKKSMISILLSVAMIMVASMSFGQQTQQTFNFNCVVEKYIEVNPAYKVMNVTTPSISPADAYGPKTNYSFFKHTYGIAYANCPFQIQMAGDNGAGDGLPIFACLEQGAHANGWDRLDTKLTFSFIINWAGYKRIQFGDNGYYGGGIKNAWTNNPYSFTEAPHDGEVGLELVSQATFLNPVPDWGKDNTWNESPDAGIYTCAVVATYIAF